jgi:predicted RNase H-like HicB family nuclease
MKTFEEYLNEPRKITLKKWTDEEESYYIVQIPSLPGCIADGYTVKEALGMIEEARKGWIGSALEEGITIPESDTQTYIIEFLSSYTKDEMKQCEEAAQKLFSRINDFKEKHVGVTFISRYKKKR